VSELDRQARVGTGSTESLIDAESTAQGVTELFVPLRIPPIRPPELPATTAPRSLRGERRPFVE
jgi:hypothetical protein